MSLVNFDHCSHSLDSARHKSDVPKYIVREGMDKWTSEPTDWADHFFVIKGTRARKMRKCGLYQKHTCTHTHTNTQKGPQIDGGFNPSSHNDAELMILTPGRDEPTRHLLVSPRSYISSCSWWEGPEHWGEIADAPAEAQMVLRGVYGISNQSGWSSPLLHALIWHAYDGFPGLSRRQVGEFIFLEMYPTVSPATPIFTYKMFIGTSLVVQWVRIHLLMQGTRVRSLVREDKICRRATKPMRLHSWSLCALEPVLSNRSHCNEKLAQRNWRKPTYHDEEPAQRKINKWKDSKCWWVNSLESQYSVTPRKRKDEVLVSSVLSA